MSTEEKEVLEFKVCLFKSRSNLKLLAIWSCSGGHLVTLGNIFTLRKLLKSKVETTKGAVSLK